MLRVRTAVPKRNLVSRFRSQDVVVTPMPWSRLAKGEESSQLWKAGSVDIAYDVDPTARADPATSWTQTVTVCLLTCFSARLLPGSGNMCGRQLRTILNPTSVASTHLVCWLHIGSQCVGTRVSLGTVSISISTFLLERMWLESWSTGQQILAAHSEEPCTTPQTVHLVGTW